MEIFCLPILNVGMSGGAEGASIVQFTIDYTSTQFIFKFKLPSTKSITINWGDGTTEDVTGQDGTTITKTSNYSGAGTYQFYLTGDEAELLYIDLSQQTFVSGDITGWSALTELEDIRIHVTGMTGDVSGFATLTKLKRVYAYDAAIEGDVSAFKDMVDLDRLWIRDTNISGDASSLYAISGMSSLLADNTSITWDTVTTWVRGSDSINIEDCGLTAQMVDDALASFAATPLSGCTIDMAGTNATRTSGSDADFATVDAVNTLDVNS